MQKNLLLQGANNFFSIFMKYSKLYGTLFARSANAGRKRIESVRNHEQMFLDWINDYRNPYPDETEDDMVFNDWLRTDLECGASTISTFLSQWQMDFLNQISRTSSMETINREAVQMTLSNITRKTITKLLFQRRSGIRRRRF